MMQWPTVALGSVITSPLALIPLALVLGLARRPNRPLALVACLATLPLLLCAPGPGLVGGVVALALLLRGITQPAHTHLFARVALLWLPVAELQPPTDLPVWPPLTWLLPVAFAASLSLAATLHVGMRWPLALLLVVLPFAPFGIAVLQPVHLVVELPLPQVAARWPFAGPGQIDTARLASLWFIAERTARALLFVALLLGWIAIPRVLPKLRSLATLLMLLALLLLVGQAVAALQVPGHPPGFALAVGQSHAWNASGVALAVARIASLFLLLRADLPTIAPRLDAWAGMALTLVLALLAATAPAFLGPNWLVDPLPLALLALLVTALVRTHTPIGFARNAAGLLQAAAVAALAGGAWAGWATASYLVP